MDTSLIINAVNNNKKVTKAITNINPDKDNVTLKTFAQMVNGLTTNSYVDATRVNKQSVNEEDSVITLNVDTENYTGDETASAATIEGGVRITFNSGSSGYIDVTY